MRLIISFFLALISYVLILLFLYSILIPKKQEKPIIHTAIITAPKKNISVSKKKKKAIYQKKVKKRVVSNVKKNVKKGSKSSFTTGGNVDFKDIFKNVKDNVPTKPINFKKNLEMSRFKGLSRVEKSLENIKMNVDISVKNNSSNINKEKMDEIINKIGQIWYDISDIAGEYAKINVVSLDGKVSAFILDTNLDKEKQEELIKRIKELQFNKNFDLNILFQTKVNK